MIAFVNGIVEEITEENVILNVNDIGYNIKISADTASRLPAPGKKVKLYTYTSVREDAILLYGFLSQDALSLFRQCITVSGIGPKGGLALLSAMDADSLRFAILSGDVKAISRAPGIGKKTAERLILDLKGKISLDDTAFGTASTGQDASPSSLSGADTQQKMEAVEALVALGYGQTESLKAVSAVEGIEQMDSGALLKAALKKMF